MCFPLFSSSRWQAIHDRLYATQLQKSVLEEREQAEKTKTLVAGQLEVAKGRIEQLEGKVRELSGEVARVSGATSTPPAALHLARPL